MNDVMTPNALYTFVVCNKHNVRDKLMSLFPSADRDASDIPRQHYDILGKSEGHPGRTLRISCGYPNFIPGYTQDVLRNSK